MSRSYCLQFFLQVDYVHDKFSKLIALYREKDAINKFIEAILEEYNYHKKVIKKHFNKNLLMSAKDEERFRLISAGYVINYLL